MLLPLLFDLWEINWFSLIPYFDFFRQTCWCHIVPKSVLLYSEQILPCLRLWAFNFWESIYIITAVLKIRTKSCKLLFLSLLQIMAPHHQILWKFTSPQRRKPFCNTPGKWISLDLKVLQSPLHACVGSFNSAHSTGWEAPEISGDITQSYGPVSTELPK